MARYQAALEWQSVQQKSVKHCSVLAGTTAVWSAAAAAAAWRAPSTESFFRGTSTLTALLTGAHPQLYPGMCYVSLESEAYARSVPALWSGD